MDYNIFFISYSKTTIKNKMNHTLAIANQNVELESDKCALHFNVLTTFMYRINLALTYISIFIFFIILVSSNNLTSIFFL